MFYLIYKDKLEGRATLAFMLASQWILGRQ